MDLGLVINSRGPQLFFDYIVKGSDGEKEALQAVWLEREWKGECAPALFFVCAPDARWIYFQAVFLPICVHSISQNRKDNM